jgi:hypothetical protein
MEVVENVNRLNRIIGYSGSLEGLESKYFYPSQGQAANFAANAGMLHSNHSHDINGKFPTLSWEPPNITAISCRANFISAMQIMSLMGGKV